MALMLGLAALGDLASSARPDAFARAPTPSPTSGEPPIDAGTSLLVVSPHPDDESLCCAGAIQRALKAGARVSIVWITSGDGSRIDALLLQGSVTAGSPGTLRALGKRRMGEARAAAASLGIAADRQLFLGYPDGGLSALLTDQGTAVYRSPTSGASQVPYAEALFPGHPYTRGSLEQDFARVLEQVHPTLILAPSIEDTHPDHRATGILTLRVLHERSERPAVRFWIVHAPEGWPAPRGLHPPLPLLPPRHTPGLEVVELALDASEEERKLTALQMHRSQMLVMPAFLTSFVRTNEVFFRPKEAPRSAAPLPVSTLKSP
jgi:LmbE family N-acetylglucosaminyl deacetylase